MPYKYPQVPVAPLQRPDEMQVANHSWMQASSGYDEMSGEQGIPTMITWCYGGKEVAVEGSWDNWRIRFIIFLSFYLTSWIAVSCLICASWMKFGFYISNRMPLQRSGKDFTIMKVLPSGVYQYRFVVDGQWKYAPDLPWAQDDAGAAYNILDLQVIIFSLVNLLIKL